VKYEEVIKRIKNNFPKQSFSLDDLRRLPYFKGISPKQLKKILRKIKDSGDIVFIGKNRYILEENIKVLAGTVSFHRDGYGFLIPEDNAERDVFLPPRTLKDIYDGDKVLVRVLEKQNKIEGEVIKIIEKGVKKVVGIIKKKKKRMFIQPLDDKLIWPLVIKSIEKKLGKIEIGDYVVGKIIDYPKNGLGTAHIEERIDGTDYDAEVIRLLIKANISEKYPQNAVFEFNEHLKKGFPDLKIRKDLRDLYFVTIDGQNAKDFDDAVFLKKDRYGYKLFVAIADVSHYVKENTFLDKEALFRGNSYYFPDRVYPMLPEILSNDLCSLKPNEERLTFVVEIHYDKKGVRKKYDIYPAIILSRHRLTYEKVDSYLKGEEYCDKELLKMLLNMQELTELLCAERFERGSIDFDLPEPTIIISITGNVENIIKSKRLVSHRIIEEFMISANRAVAEWFMENDIPTIYRVHEEPDREKIIQLGIFLKTLGYTLKEKVTPKDLQYVLSQFRHTIYEKFVNKVILRSMKQARYSSKPLGHFGLALEHYLHFTSPIRRYSDLIVHRQLLKYKFSNKKPKDIEKEQEKLEKISEAISKRERVAWEIEKEIFNFASAKIMSDKIGDEFEGVVSSVTPSGLYVELIEYFVEGFVPVENMKDDFYIFDEKTYRLLGKRKKKIYHIGKEVRVKLVDVDLNSKRIEFLLL